MNGVAIVGTHRGGTSAVAGVVHALGFYMGDDLLPPSKHNPRGYFESYRIMQLHTAMMGGDIWYPSIDVEPYLEEYENVVGDLGAHGRWAVKDPRFCYLLPYLSQFYESAIIVIRSTVHSAESLFVRGGHTRDETVELQAEHAIEMFRSAREFPGDTFYLHYDSLVSNTEHIVEKLAEWLEVSLSREAIDAVDPSLRHHGG